MLLRISENKINVEDIDKVVDCLKGGGVIIYPTDTVYGMGCDINQPKAIERICRIKRVNPAKVNFSFICFDLSHLSDYTKVVDTPTYKLMKKALPGPFTFVLNASSKVPKLFMTNKKTVGIRIPDNPICLEIVNRLGNPIMSTSVHDSDEIIDYITDPEVIYENYKHLVDIVVAGGYGNNQPSTVVDCTNGDYLVLRQGLGNLTEYL